MDVNQVNLDDRLQSLQGLRVLAGQVTPEQTEQVRERVSTAGSNLDAAGLEGALDLLCALPRGVGRLPDLLGGMRDVVGGADRSVGDALSAVNPFGSSGGSGPGMVAEPASAMLGQLGNFAGSAPARWMATRSRPPARPAGRPPRPQAPRPPSTSSMAPRNTPAASAISRSRASDASLLLSAQIDRDGAALDRDDTAVISPSAAWTSVQPARRTPLS